MNDVDPTGIPRAGSGPERFIMLVGLLVAVLALIVSLGWIVFNRLVAG
jgi:flagellar biogenesis protein FliO